MVQGNRSYSSNELSPEYYAQWSLQADPCGSRSGNTSVYGHVSDSQRPWDPIGSNSRPDPRIVSYLYEQAIARRNCPKTRRRLNSEERKRCALVRRIGACEKCRKGKRKCTHVGLHSCAGGINIDERARNLNLRPRSMGDGDEPADENHQTLPSTPASVCSMISAEVSPTEHAKRSFSPNQIVYQSFSVQSSPYLPSLSYGSSSESREQETSRARDQALGTLGDHEGHDPVGSTEQQEPPTAWSLDDICRYAFEGHSRLTQDISFSPFNSPDGMSSFVGYESSDSVCATTDVERWTAPHGNGGKHPEFLKRVETKWHIG